MNEINIAFKSINRGISFDGLPPKILQIVPYSLKEVFLVILQMVFTHKFPENWRLQILHAITKHGHTYLQPSLRGIAIAPLICRLYDTIMDNRFQNWYIPNAEQSGFRPKQGCLFPLFTLVIMICFCKENNRDMFVGFLDFEKAFDYVNRPKLITDLMAKGCGKNYVRALSDMYEESLYVPKINCNTLGDNISTKYGVTQGKRSSTNLFSFYVSDMNVSLRNFHDNFLDPYNLLQLADDTSLIAESFDSIRLKFIALFKYATEKYQIPNTKKTVYAHFSSNPTTAPMYIDDRTFLSSIDAKLVHVYLGMSFLPTNDIDRIISHNINMRMKHVAKFYAWLEINENTPIETKLLILDNCVLRAILYGCGAWGDISKIDKKIATIEIQMLKRVLCVKKGTSNDIIFYELRRANVISKILDRQYKFFQKLLALTNEQ